MKSQFKYGIYFLILLVGISFLYGYHKIIFYSPYSNHQWRQTDGLSIALNYFKEGMKFFEPKIHFQYSDDGKAIGEFPVIYYINAAIWKVTGQSYFTARLLNLSIVFTGFIALYKTVYILSKSYFTSMVIPIFAFCSPLIAFYSNNFLVNVPALSLVFISWYFLVRYSKSKRVKHLIFFSLYGSLAVLLRSTMLIGLAPVFLIFFLEKIKLFKPKLFTQKLWVEFIVLSLPCIFLFSWLLFVNNYNTTNNSIYFLTQTRTLWSIDWNEIKSIWNSFNKDILPTIYHKGVLLLFAGLIILMFARIKQINKYLVVFNLTIFFALTFYIILWYANLNVHDYYLIELFLFVPPLLLSISDYSKNKLSRFYHSIKIKVALVSILLFSLLYSVVLMRQKYNFRKTVFTSILLPEEKIKLWDWFHWDYNSKLRAYETITPYLRRIGINREDIVVSIPDQSTNISLFFMDQKGYTSLYQDEISIKDQLDYFMENGAEYLIINDTSLYQQEDFVKYRKNKIGVYQNIEIFDLKSIDKFE